MAGDLRGAISSYLTLTLTLISAAGYLRGAISSYPTLTLTLISAAGDLRGAPHPPHRRFYSQPEPETKPATPT